MIGKLSEFQRRLLQWYDAHRRDLPWRLSANSIAGAELDPYHVLVSEAMLQQTQVVTVVPYFVRFLAKFPTMTALANADSQDVLRAWQGLGYYSRARNLQKAAAIIVAEFNGRVPGTVEQLLKLPGVGRYTAGAVASLAYGTRAPILDGNVSRVIARIDAIREDPRDPATREILWARAEQILPARRIGDYNSALMELGAMICTPRAPRCLICPVNKLCNALAVGLAEQIPPPRKCKPLPLINRWVLCIRRGDLYLIEQRRPGGRWAGMWQFVTTEAAGRKPTQDWVDLQFGLRTTKLIKTGTVKHSLTHRHYRFEVFSCESKSKNTLTVPPRRWISLIALDKYPMPLPHLKIIKMLTLRDADSSGK